jgi:hypothetical protein
MAAQQGEICHISIGFLDYLPVEWFVNYCRNHKKLESLDLMEVSFIADDEDGGTGVSYKRSDNNNNNNNNIDALDPPSAFTSLKTLSLRNISFNSTRASSIFEQFGEDLRLSSLTLGRIDDSCGIEEMDYDTFDDMDNMDYIEDEPEKNDDDDSRKQAKTDLEQWMSATDSSDDDEIDVRADNANDSERTDRAPVGKETIPDPDDDSVDEKKHKEDDDEPEYENECDNDCNPIDPEITGRIVAKLIKPSVEHLYFTSLCRKKHFKAAMESGKSSVVHLWVNFYRRKHFKLTSLARMIQGAVQLNHLTLRNLAYRPWLRPEPAFFQDVAACATLTHVRLDRFHSKAAAQLQGIVSRNCELARFVANPSTCPIDAMLNLVSQFSDTYCPSGLYMLARGLPEMIAFDKIKSKNSSTEPKLKKQKVS